MEGFITHNLGTAEIVAEWLIRLGMLIVVPRRRTPQAAQAWLLLVFFLPIPGLLLYLAIGRPRFPAWRHERFLKLRPLFEELDTLLTPHREACPVDPDTAGLLQTVGGLPPTCGNEIEFIGDYDQAVRSLVADIEAAREHVLIAVYIFADDSTGGAVIEALGYAAARGVKCYVMIDALGSRRWVRRTERRLRAVGVEVVRALPFHLLRGRTRGDMRNHRKLFIIDGTIGYAGSQNLVDKDFRPGVTNRELVVRTQGPIVTAMTAVFLMDWYLETETMPLQLQAPASEPHGGGASAQLLPSGADFPAQGFQTLLVWKLHQACDRVVLTTPYFVPDEDVLSAMRTAVLRGVRVEIIVSAIADQKLVSFAQRSYYDELLRSGVIVHEYRDYLLHAKLATFDGTMAIVGSSNVDVRSFQLNEEVSLVLLDSPSVRSVQAIQDDYIAHSDTVDLDQWRARPKLVAFGQNLARLVSPLL